MQRIILRHLKGSKSSQVEEFAADDKPELTLGRDPASTVAYDPTQDDLVSRQHAKIVRDASDPDKYILTDLGSRNGTFVNKQKVTGSTALAPGDVVQFGPGGPEFQFDLDPRPATLPAATRMADIPSAPATREGAVPLIPAVSAPDAMTTGAATGSGATGTAAGAAALGMAASGIGATGGADTPSTSGGSKPYVGRETMERTIAQTKSESNKTMLFAGLALAAIFLLIAGGLAYQSLTSKRNLEGQLAATGAKLDETENKLSESQAAMENQVGELKNAGFDAAKIDEANRKAIVYLEVSWKLIYTPTGSQLYHTYQSLNGQQVAVYVRYENDVLEPLLTTDPKEGRPIGGTHSGSGFVVTSDGFILTNRHVAATWKTAYQFPTGTPPGVILDAQTGNLLTDANGDVVLQEQPPVDWVPANTRQARQRLQGDFEGRNDVLNITFAQQSDRIPATLARVSDEHDVAMVKINMPGEVPKVTIKDEYDQIEPGENIVVMGYPAVSPASYGVVSSQDMFNRQMQIKEIPDPTTSVGNVGRVVRGREVPKEGRNLMLNELGDVYQLQVNTTGGGNSGGPVFNEKGEVVGVFFASGQRSAAAVTFAVPIRYGLKIMGTSSDTFKADESTSGTADAEPAKP